MAGFIYVIARSCVATTLESRGSEPYFNIVSLPGDCHVVTLLAMTIFYPQRAVGTHRAEGTSLLPKAKTSHHRFYKVSQYKIEKRMLSIFVRAVA